MKRPYSHLQRKGNLSFPLCADRLGTGLSDGEVSSPGTFKVGCSGDWRQGRTPASQPGAVISMGRNEHAAAPYYAHLSNCRHQSGYGTSCH